jgi:hypothetical protein
MNQNPYEAPQTIALTDSARIDPARDQAELQLGARLISYALLLGLGLVVADIFLTFQEAGDVWSWLNWLLPIIGTIAVLLEAWGIWLLRKAPPASSVSGLVRGSLFCLVLSVVGYWAAVGIWYLVNDLRWYLEGYLFFVATQCLTNVLLFWSLYRIGRYTQTRRLSTLALITLYYGFVVNSYDLIGSTSVIWSGDENEIVNFFAEQQNYFGHPWRLAARFSAFFLAILTLRAVHKISAPEFADLQGTS